MNLTRTFDPNAASSGDSGIFGLPYTATESSVIFVPVPWDVTTSYRPGTAQGPGAILEASRQVDLYDGEVERPYESGLFIENEDETIATLNRVARKDAELIIEVGGDIGNDTQLHAALERVNQAGEKLNQLVHQKVAQILESGKIPALIGGDHATPFGAFTAVAEKLGPFGILHFDAHSDTRKAFEGFEWSHASIMHNALARIPQIKKLVQVGIRDFCEQEAEFCREQGTRVSTFFDFQIQKHKIEGKPLSVLVHEMVSQLPREIWVSFDIDGLDPKLCPNTGTPVPGGLEFAEANYILSAVVRSGRKIIGFDLNEVAPGPEGDEWDANVGARLLYKMTAWTLASQGKRKIRG